MKAKFLVTSATAFLLALSLNTYAQPAPPSGPRPPAPKQEELKQVSTITGQITDWVSNDDYVYDGFYIQTAGEKLLVKFPAHIGAGLTSALKKGSSVTVNGVSAISPTGAKEVRMVSIVTGGKTFYDTPPAAPTTAPSPEFVTASGKIAQAQKNKRGDASGFILDNKTILRVPPHVAAQLSQTAVAGATVSYTGVKKSANNNEAKAENYTIIHCQTITINGTQYLTR